MILPVFPTLITLVRAYNLFDAVRFVDIIADMQIRFQFLNGFPDASTSRKYPQAENAVAGAARA